MEIKNTFAENEEDLNIVMPMYNLLEYSNNYSMTSGSLWNYYRDELNDSANKNSTYNKKKYKNRAAISRFSKYKTKIMGSTSNNNNILDAEIVVP